MVQYLLLGSFLLLLLTGAGCVNAGESVNVVNNSTSSESVVTSSNNTDSLAMTKVFNVTAKNFTFSITEIKVKKGDRVTVNFSSTDGYHDWVVDEFKAFTQKVQTGGSASVTFTADKTGIYEYYCSIGSHRKMGMVGTLIVE